MLLFMLFSALLAFRIPLANTHPAQMVSRTAGMYDSAERTPDSIDPPHENLSMRRTILRENSPGPRNASSTLNKHTLLSADLRSASRAYLPLSNLSATLHTSPKYPVDCFNPYSTRLGPVNGEDCRVVIDHIILAYPDPMSPKTFGYNDVVDIDLRKIENEKWLVTLRPGFPFTENCVSFEFV